MRVHHAADGPDRFTLDDDLLIEGDCAAVLPRLPAGAFDMAYVDPPFNTGGEQRRERLRVVADEDGDRMGFGGRRYRSEAVGRPTGP